MSETKLKFLLSQEWLSFKDIHDIFTYKDFSIDYRDTAETLSRSFDKKEIDLYVELSKFHDYESFFKDKGYKQNIYLSHNNRVISKWYKKDFFGKYYINDGFFEYNNKLFKKDGFRNNFHNLYLKILEGGVTYSRLSNNRKAGFTIEKFILDDLEISFTIITKGDDYRYREPLPDIYSTADENLAIYMKKMEFIEHFRNILDLEPYIKRIDKNNDNNNSNNEYDNYISQIVDKIKFVNTADIKLTLNQEYISHKDLSLIYGELIDIEKLSSIVLHNNSKLKFYFQIHEDKLANYFLENNKTLEDGSIYDNCKDEAFLNDILKGVSTFENNVHYVEIVEPFLEYDNNSFNGYIQTINICLENGYRAVSKGKFNSIFIDRLLFKKYKIIEYLSSIEIFPKNTEIKKHIEEKLMFIPPYKPWSNELTKEYEKLKPSENLIKEYLFRNILNLEELALIFNYFGINYDTGDVYNSLQTHDIYIEEDVNIYEVDTKDFIATYKDILGLEPYIIYTKSLQSKPAINQDDNYKYSEALKPYNDIILAFDSEYQEYKDKTKASSIDSWLKTNYPVPNYSRDEHRVLKKLIKAHYKLKK
ncbi:hypothetical protein QIW57_06465 [Francisellaceae bacterium CB52]